eukprot:GHVL01004347.1.p1 GENE.GHVL01004347.1~~GHVL01004347.1.p1  ORF type:complete len:637 (+),score=83.23 GHVL01004347.1:56-1966(+)
MRNRSRGVSSEFPEDDSLEEEELVIADFDAQWYIQMKLWLDHSWTDETNIRKVKETVLDAFPQPDDWVLSRKFIECIQEATNSVGMSEHFDCNLWLDGIASPMALNSDYQRLLELYYSSANREDESSTNKPEDQVGENGILDNETIADIQLAIHEEFDSVFPKAFVDAVLLTNFVDPEASHLALSALKRLLTEYFGRNCYSAALFSKTQTSLGEVLKTCAADRLMVKNMLYFVECLNGKDMCKYQVNGYCGRGASCLFNHYPYVTPCRFWQKGFCMRGDGCVYLHALLPSSNITSHIDSIDSQWMFDDASFPASSDDAPLEHYKSDVAQPAAGDCRVASDNNGSQVEWEASKVSKGPSFKRPGSQSSDEDDRSSSSYASILMKKVEAVPHHQGAFKDGIGGDRPIIHTHTNYERRRHDELWRSTGSSVSTKYARLRVEARQLAITRNACFMNSVKAFQSGQKQLARDLGAQGRQYNEEMHNAHQRVAWITFIENNFLILDSSKLIKTQWSNWHSLMESILNDDFDVESLWQEPIICQIAQNLKEVDLHGLHIQEAINFVDWVLQQHLQRENTVAGRNLVILGGSGHHSIGMSRNKMQSLQGSRLLQAVQEQIVSWGGQVTLFRDKNGFVGSLRAKF